MKIGITLSLLFIASIFFFGQKKLFPHDNQSEFVSTGVISIGASSWRVEEVGTEASRALGLGYRDSLCDHCGMLFLFPSLDQHAFWMKGMRFPIDILWIRDGRVVHIERNIQSDFLGTLIPPEPSDSVLEVGAGESANISLGEAVIRKEYFQ